MTRTLPFLLLLFSVGCGCSDVSTAKYFGGHPTEHWLKAIRNPDANTRKKAADVLGNVGPVDPGAIPALIVALKDPAPRVRDAAVLALSKIGKPAAEAVPAIEEAARDRDPTVRTHAFTALERVRGIK
jgi:HEAT repeat protein